MQFFCTVYSTRNKKTLGHAVMGVVTVTITSLIIFLEEHDAECIIPYRVKYHDCD